MVIDKVVIRIDNEYNNEDISPTADINKGIGRATIVTKRQDLNTQKISFQL